MTNEVTVVPPSKNALGGGLEGAERTSRETALWSAPIISPDRQINPVKDDADARARDVVQNSGMAMGAVQTHRDSIVGTQYRLNAHPDWKILSKFGKGFTEAWAEEFQEAAEGLFNLLSDSEDCWFDASRNQTMTGLLRLGIASFFMTGEVLNTVEWIREQQRPFKTAFQLISPTRLSNPWFESDSRSLRRGVKRNFRGEALGYYIKRAHPTDFWIDATSDANEWDYVEARKPWGRLQVIHIIEPLQPEQTRGISDMVSALKDFRMTRKFKEVVLQNAVVNATYAAAVESDLPKEVIFGAMGAGGPGFMGQLAQYLQGLGDYTTASKNIAIDGVKMPHLYPGTKLNVRPMGTPGGVGTQFEESLHRHVAASLGLSYEEFSRDFTKTNYSSARASMGQTERYMRGRKKSVADRQANAYYSLWLEEMLNAGMLPLPSGVGAEIFYNPVARAALLSCDWIGSSRGQIDEMKETQAAVLRISSGLSTYEKEAARLGDDFRRTFAQAAREKKLMEKLGLTFTTDATKPGANQAQQPMKGNDEEDDDGKPAAKAEISPLEQAQIDALAAHSEYQRAMAKQALRRPKVEKPSDLEQKRFALTEKIVGMLDRQSNERQQ